MGNTNCTATLNCHRYGYAQTGQTNYFHANNHSYSLTHESNTFLACSPDFEGNRATTYTSNGQTVHKLNNFSFSKLRQFGINYRYYPYPADTSMNTYFGNRAGAIDYAVDNKHSISLDNYVNNSHEGSDDNFGLFYQNAYLTITTSNCILIRNVFNAAMYTTGGGTFTVSGLVFFGNTFSTTTDGSYPEEEPTTFEYKVPNFCRPPQTNEFSHSKLEPFFRLHFVFFLIKD